MVIPNFYRLTGFVGDHLGLLSAHQASPVTLLFLLLSCRQQFAVVLSVFTPPSFAGGSWIFLEPLGSSRYRIFSQTTISSGLSVFSTLVKASQLTSVSVTSSQSLGGRRFGFWVDTQPVFGNCPKVFLLHYLTICYYLALFRTIGYCLVISF